MELSAYKSLVVLELDQGECHSAAKLCRDEDTCVYDDDSGGTQLRGAYR